MRAFAVLLICACIARADVRLPAIIASDMVLQRNALVPLWGWAAPGEQIVICGDWPDAKPANAVATPDGRWSLKLQTPGPGGPYSVSITGQNTLTLTDVMVGEVWICSGQSNMEWSVAQSKDAAQEIAAADFPKIRQFAVPKRLSAQPETDCDGHWTVCSPATVPGYTAVGYFFGRELHKTLNIPIGLINASWGGTVAEAWASEDTIATIPDFAKDLARVRQQRGDPATLAAQVLDARARWWSSLDAATTRMVGDCTARGFDDSAWETVKLPGPWAGDLARFDGVGVYRRTIPEIPEELVGKELHLALGPIDDMDTVWFDGTRIGGFETPGYWNAERHYRIPPALATDGPHTIVIRVVDTSGIGGLTGAPEMMYLKKLVLGEPRGDPDQDEQREEEEETVHLAGDWKFHIGPALQDLGQFPEDGLSDPNMPTVLYNGLISPVQPYAIRGAIWYQGESNRGRADQYRTLFPALITDWRRRWAEGDFPFYFVQIAPFNYGGDTGQTAQLREAQLMSMSLPSTGMAVTMDIGNPADIHPTNKQEVGRRLALWALAKTYGQMGLEYSGPIYTSMKIEGSTIRISFDYADHLAARSGPLSCFEIAGPDGKFVPAEAKIDGGGVVVSSPSVPAPAAVRYSWGTADQPNLFNGAGLPASPFRTNPPPAAAK